MLKKRVVLRDNKALRDLPFVCVLFIMNYLQQDRSGFVIRNGRGCVYQLFGYFRNDKFRNPFLIFRNFKIGWVRYSSFEDQKGIDEKYLPSGTNGISFCRVTISTLPKYLKSLDLLDVMNEVEVLEMIPVSLEAFSIRFGNDQRKEFRNGEFLSKLKKCVRLASLALEYNFQGDDGFRIDMEDLFEDFDRESFDDAEDFLFKLSTTFPKLKSFSFENAIVKNQDLFDYLPKNLEKLEIGVLTPYFMPNISHLKNLRKLKVIGCAGTPRVEPFLLSLSSDRVRSIVFEGYFDFMEENGECLHSLPESTESLSFVPLPGYSGFHFARIGDNLKSLPSFLSKLIIKDSTAVDGRTFSFLPNSLKVLKCSGTQFLHDWNSLPKGLTELKIKNYETSTNFKNAGTNVLSQRQFDFIGNHLVDLKRLTIGSDTKMCDFHLCGPDHEYFASMGGIVVRPNGPHFGLCAWKEPVFNFSSLQNLKGLEMLKMYGAGFGINDQQQVSNIPGSVNVMKLHKSYLNDEGMKLLPKGLEKITFSECVYFGDEGFNLLKNKEKFPNLKTICMEVTSGREFTQIEWEGISKERVEEFIPPKHPVGVTVETMNSFNDVDHLNFLVSGWGSHPYFNQKRKK